MTQTADLTERVTNLETLLMHVQRTIDDLSGVVLSQQKQIDRLAARLDASATRAAPSPDSPAPDDELL